MIDNNVQRFCVDRALQVEAAKHLVDGSAGLLADRTDIYVDDNGTVYGADAAVSELLKNKPHLARATEHPASAPTSVANLPPGSKEAAKAIAAFDAQWRKSTTRGTAATPAPAATPVSVANLKPSSKEARDAIAAFDAQWRK